MVMIGHRLLIQKTRMANINMFNKYGMHDMKEHEKEWDDIWKAVSILKETITPLADQMEPMQARLIWLEAASLLQGFGAEYLLMRSMKMRKQERASSAKLVLPKGL